MNEYRYMLEKYRGRSTRHRCPQCGRKHAFTRYIDTHNNNRYLSDNVGKCNRLDNYHYLIIITTHHVSTLPITHGGAMLNGKMGKT
mgnify:CR=1 FL=1